jgi:hypothetical protein
MESAPTTYAAIQNNFGFARSGQWPRVRDEHLQREGCCQVCGGKSELNVHHIRPYHLFPKLELDPDNLITLCEGSTVNCHILFGHLLNWASYNRHVVEDAKEWRSKIIQRPRTVGTEFVRFRPDDDLPLEPNNVPPTENATISQ